VEDAEPALAGHRDGGAGLGDRVHGGADERDVELDPTGQPCAGVDVLREHVAVGGEKEDVVERQRFTQRLVEQGDLRMGRGV